MSSRWVVPVAVAVTLACAAVLGGLRLNDRPPVPGETPPTLALPESGDSPVFAVSPPRDTVSPQEWSDILPRLQKAADRPDAEAADRRRLAIALYNLGRLEETEAIYRSMLEAGEDPVVRNRLGNVLRDRGDLTGAEEAYRRAMTTDPALPAPYVNLAELLWQLHRDDEASEVLDDAAKAVAPEAVPAIERARDSLSRAGATTPTTTVD